MKVECSSGYFKFYETNPGQVSRFMSLYGFNIVRNEDYYTFSFLKNAPDYSIAGMPYLNLVATKTFEGKPSEIMKENGFVFDFTKNILVLKVSILKNVKISTSGSYFISDGMIQPGSLTDDGSRVMDYAAFFEIDRMNFKYTEVSYE